MVYSNQFIAVIKHRGKILREFSDNIIRLPFGADYSLLLKNKHHRKALVKVSIDGKDVLDGNSLIVGPNETTELKGFMKRSVVKNRFRFIEKTREISEFRGNHIEDGLVEVNYQFEEPRAAGWYKPPGYKGYEFGNDVSTFYSNTNYTSRNISCSVDETKHDAGITVSGKETRQDFMIGNIGTLERSKHKIILHLKGKVKRKRVDKPVTTKTKLRCSTCGRRWKSSLKYCGNCSTYLH